MAAGMQRRSARICNAGVDRWRPLLKALGPFRFQRFVYTVAQLGFHQKPVGFLNIQDGNGGGGFYDHLLAFFDTCVDAVSLVDAVRKHPTYNALSFAHI